MKKSTGASKHDQRATVVAPEKHADCGKCQTGTPDTDENTAMKRRPSVAERYAEHGKSDIMTDWKKIKSDIRQQEWEDIGESKEAIQKTKHANRLIDYLDQYFQPTIATLATNFSRGK